MAQCFDIITNDHRGTQKKAAGPFGSEILANREKEKLDSTKPLPAGWIYELVPVDCPKMERPRRTGKTRGSKGRSR